LSRNVEVRCHESVAKNIAGRFENLLARLRFALGATELLRR
jgi:hypothetical protein